MKKLIALIAVVATMVSLFALPVSAKNYFVDDFENPPASGVLTDIEGWDFYSAKMTGVTVFEDGMLKITHTGLSNSGDRPFPRKTYTASPNHVLTFDIKVEYPSNVNPSLSFQSYALGNSSTRILYNYARNSVFASGYWYNVMIVVNCNDNAENNVHEVAYYKKKDDTAWKVFADVTKTITPGSNKNWFRLGFDMNPLGGTCWFDNWTAYDEFWFDNMNISLKDATVEEIADVTSGGTLSFDFDLYDANISLNADKTIADNVTAKTVIVALDKNMKMVGCSTVNIPLKGGKNTVSASLELSDDEDAANYYGNLTDGGQINFYMWDNMQPLCDPIVIK